MESSILLKSKNSLSPPGGHPFIFRSRKAFRPHRARRAHLPLRTVASAVGDCPDDPGPWVLGQTKAFPGTGSSTDEMGRDGAGKEDLSLRPNPGEHEFGEVPQKELSMASRVDTEGSFLPAGGNFDLASRKSLFMGFCHFTGPPTNVSWFRMTGNHRHDANGLCPIHRLGEESGSRLGKAIHSRSFSS